MDMRPGRRQRQGSSWPCGRCSKECQTDVAILCGECGKRFHYFCEDLASMDTHQLRKSPLEYVCISCCCYGSAGSFNFSLSLARLSAAKGNFENCTKHTCIKYILAMFNRF